MTQNSGKEDNCRFLCQETRQNTNCISKYRPILCQIYRAWGGKRYSTEKCSSLQLPCITNTSFCPSYITRGQAKSHIDLFPA